MNASEEQSQISDFEIIKSELQPSKFELKSKKYSVEPRISEHQEEEELANNNTSAKKKKPSKNGSGDKLDSAKGKKPKSVVDKLLVKKDKKKNSSEKARNDSLHSNNELNQPQEITPNEKLPSGKEEIAAAAEKQIQEEQSNAENDNRIYIIMKKEQSGGQIQGFLLSTPENEISILKEELGKFAREVNLKAFQVLRKCNF